MKIKDIIIVEAKKGTLRPDLKSTLNRSNKFATANDRFYDLNRVMMAAAMANGDGSEIDMDEKYVVISF